MGTSYSFVSLPFCTYFSTAAARSAFCRPSLLKPSSLSSVFCKSLNTADLDSYFTASKCAFSTSTMSTKRVLVPIADGSEEIESVCIIDVLRRAGAEVVVASVMDSQTVVCSRKVKLVADAVLDDVKDQTFDAIVLPGGMPGAEHLRDSSTLVSMLKAQKAASRCYAAICASPAVVFQKHNLFDGVSEMTCHPNFTSSLPSTNSADKRVVVDGICITSGGPGTAIEFALKIVEQLFDRRKAEQVAKPMLVPSW